MIIDDVFAVIAEGTRREILGSLRSGDKAVGELVEELAVSQPTVSKHLKVLREAGLVSMRAQGQKRFYSLQPEPLRAVAAWLDIFGMAPAAARATGPTPDGRPAVTVPATVPAGDGTGTAGDGAGTAGDGAVPAGAGAVDAAAAPTALVSGGSGSPVSSAAGPHDQTDGGPQAGGPQAADLPPSGDGEHRPPVRAHAQAPEATGGAESGVQVQLSRTMGRAAERAADLFAQLPKLRRRRD